MNLRTFCADGSTTYAEIARRLAVTRQYVTAMANGLRNASDEVAVALVRETRAIAEADTRVAVAAGDDPGEVAWVTLDDLPLSPGTQQLVDLVREEERAHVHLLRQQYAASKLELERQVEELERRAEERIRELTEQLEALGGRAA